MRVARSVIEERRRVLSRMLAERRYLPVGEICKLFSVSEATARRDLSALAKSNQIRRTHGGAVAFFPERFPSFRQRLEANSDSKRALARRATSYLRPGDKIFLDSGTTPYLVAAELKAKPVAPLVIVTANLPAAELLAQVEGIAVHLTGGQLVPSQSVLLGGAALAALGLWKFDIGVFSGQGMDARGIWNAPPEVVKIQREAIKKCRRAVALLDKSKLGKTPGELLTVWKKTMTLLTDATPAQLKKHGVSLPG